MTNLTDTIKLYETKLSELKLTTQPSFDQVVSVLLTRDEIQYFIEEDDAEHTQNLEEIKKISEYDNLLKAQIKQLRIDWNSEDKKEYLNRKDKLETEIDIYTRFPNSWWWQSFRLDISWWDKLDWLTNLGTIATSILATTIFSQTVNTALAIGGLNFWGTVVTLSQAAFGVVFAGGTLTDKGKEKVEKSLDKIKIPRHLHSQVIFLAAIILSLFFWGTKQIAFSVVEKKYTEEAEQYFKEGKFYQSAQKYQKLQILNPDDLKISANLGKAYEFNQQFNKAFTEYQKGIGEKEPQSLIGMSRIWLFRELPESRFLGKISDNSISRVHFYLNEAKAKILDKKYKYINELIKEIKNGKLKLSDEVQQRIDWIENNSNSNDIETFHKVVLALSKINDEIKLKKISSFLNKLYSKEDRELKLLIEARFVEIIILNWSKRNFSFPEINLTSGHYDRKPIEYEYKPVNISIKNPTATDTRDNKFRKMLINKYSQLPEYKKLNCYVRIDNYLNAIERELKNLKSQEPRNYRDDKKLENLQTEPTEIKQECLNKPNDSQEIILSSYEIQLMLEMLNFVEKKAKYRGLFSRK